MGSKKWHVHNPSAKKRVIVTKSLPGQRWLDILAAADCRIEVCTSSKVLEVEEIQKAIGNRCDGAIGQLTESWGEELFEALQNAGGKAYSNYAVGFNNVDLEAATRWQIPVGNTPGVLTETTAEMAVTLTFAAARRVCDLHPNKGMEAYMAAYNAFLKSQGEQPVTCKRVEKVEELLAEADCVSLHTILDDTTHHLINAGRLSLMKPNAILINTSRGPVIDEAALVDHCRNQPEFKAGLDVFEDEPALKPGLADLPNVVIVPHIASATSWTRTGMATLAAGNVAAILQGFPVWEDAEIGVFLEGDPPKAAPSILNAKELGMAFYNG